MSERIPPKVASVAYKTLHKEILGEGAFFDVLRETQISLRNIVGYRKKYIGVDKFRVSETVKSNTTVFKACICDAYAHNLQKLHALQSDVFRDMELGDRFVVLHVDNKYGKRIGTGGYAFYESQKSMREQLYEGFSTIQTYLLSFSPDKRPKYIFGTSYLADKLSRYFGFSCYDLPEDIAMKTMSYNTIHGEDSLPTLVEKSKHCVHDILSTLIKQTPYFKHKASHYTHKHDARKKFYKEKEKLQEKYSAQDIKLAVMSTQDFLAINFERYRPTTNQ